MKSYLKYYVVFILSLNFLPGQNNNVKLEDINMDGIKDSVYWAYDYGSTVEGMYCAVVNGRTREKFEMDNKICYCRIKNTILIPPALRKPENKLFLEEIKSRLLPVKETVADPSLQWILNGTKNNKDLSNHEYFDKVIFSHTLWHHEDLKLPHDYYLEMKGEQLDYFFESDEAVPPWYKARNNEGWLIYHAQKHYNHFELYRDSLVQEDSSRVYKIFTTAHGVVVKKGSAYAWVFITDYNLTGGPERLNFESVKKVKLLNGYLVVEQSLSPAFNSKLFVIDIEKGICARIKYNFLSEKLFEFKKGEIFIKDKEINFGFEPKKLFESLEQFHKAK